MFEIFALIAFVGIIWADDELRRRREVEKHKVRMAELREKRVHMKRQSEIRKEKNL